ncbi:MAG: hypothetical protein HZA79_07315 [Sphingobacteriales bacterium]|nr:hypothetical protein [Sphingobacteriales bacterium]
MKKVFLLFGLAGGYGLAAQQADLTDLGEKIRQRIAKETEVKFQLDFWKNRALTAPANGYGSPQNFKGKPVFTLPNQDQVWVLPTDRMPCVVPDMTAFQVMPVAGKLSGTGNPEQAGRIPNPALPVQ